MKHTICFFLLLFLTGNGASLYAQLTQTVRVEASELTITVDPEGYAHLSLPEAYPMETIGQPALPVYIQSFVVPADAEVTGITVSNLTRQAVGGSYRIFPAQAPVPTNTLPDPVAFTPPDSSVYNAPAPFPGKQVEILSDRFEKAYHLVTVKIYPVEYLPVTGELTLCSFSFTLNYRTVRTASEAENDDPTPPRRRTISQRAIEYLVENKADVARFQPPAPVAGVQRALFGRDPEETVPDYLILTNRELQPAFQVLADWKTKKGIKTRIQLVEEITAAYPGADTPEKIRNYLKEAYRSYGDNLFVLLGGHTNVIPERMVEGSHENKWNPSDLYYATVEGTWNADNDHLFGEGSIDNIDYTYAFYLGRAPVENPAQAQAFVNKVISYEKASGLPNPAYFNNVLMATGFIKGPPENSTFSLFDNYNLHQTGKYIRERSSAAKTWLLFDNHDCSDQTRNYNYDSNPCSLYPGDEELNRTNFLAALQNGGNSSYGHFHIVYQMDHSSPISMGASSKHKGETVSKNDFGALTNNGYWQILMSGGCDPATFNLQCIAKEYLNNPNGGGVAFIGNADIGWSNEAPQFRRFMEFLYNPTNTMGHSLGYAFQRASGSDDQRRRLTLLGDPEMPVWTATPKTLAVTRSATRIAATGAYRIALRIANLPAGEEALVCLQKGNEIYSRHIVTNTDTCLYTVTPQTSGNLDLTVTAHNFRPYETSFSVTGSTNLQVENLSIDNTVYRLDTAQVTAGRTVEMKIALRCTATNSGLAQLTSWPAMLTCSSPYVSILQSQANFPPVPAGQTRTSEGAFSIRIDPDAPDLLAETDSPLTFELTITGANNTPYTVPFSIDVTAPRIEAGNRAVTSSVTESAYTVHYFTAALFNAGRGEASGVQAALRARSGTVVECSTDAFSYPDFAPKQTHTNASPAHYWVKVPAGNANAPILLTLDVENEYGKTWSFDFDLNSRPPVVNAGTVNFRGYKNEIELYWPRPAGATAYRIYRSDVNADGTPVGNYRQVNAFPVSSGYFKDTELNEVTKYAYKIASVHSNGNETAWPDASAVIAWTSLLPAELFPVTMPTEGTGKNRNTSSISVCDVNGDSLLEIFTAINQGDNGRFGIVAALKADGTDLFDTDNNPTQYSKFAQWAQSIQAPVALGDLSGNGEYQVLSVTRNFADATNYLTCHNIKDSNNDNNPDLLWQVPVNQRYRRGAILANVDNSRDRSLEIIICHNESNTANSPDGIIRIFDKQGNLLWRFGKGNGYSALAAADLDDDGDIEIVAGFEDGVYVWHHDGTPFSVNPFYRPTGYSMDSNPVICDLNKDGRKEILVSGRSGSQRQLFAVTTDRTLLTGWGSNQKVTFTNSISSVHEPSVGDLNNDGYLEVVALGEGNIKIWDRNGALLREIALMNVSSPAMITPILADVDSDNRAEIVFGYDFLIHAYKLDGRMAEGFPLHIDAGAYGILGSIAVADVDQDGKNEVVAAAENKIYLWKTEGNPAHIEWGSGRQDSHNRGEYTCPATVIGTSQVWSGPQNLCGDLRIRSTLVLRGNQAELTMQAGTKIMVEAGGELRLSGGVIHHADIVALPGSKVVIEDGAFVQLSRTGSLDIAKGAVLEYLNGTIDRVR